MPDALRAPLARARLRLAPLAVAAACAAALAAAPVRAEDAAAPAGAPDDAGASGEPELVDGIAAQVGTDVVLISDVERLAAPLERSFREQGATEADLEQLRAEMLDRLIERKLIAGMARRAEIEATDIEIDEAIAAVARENQIDVDQLRESVVAQGLPWEAYRRRIADEIVQQKVVGGMIRSRISVDESEIRAVYEERFANQPTSGEELHLQHIAVGASDAEESSKRAACNRVNAAYARVQRGEDFMAVAREVSEGTPDLGWVHRSSLAPWMAAEIDSMQPGQISRVLELPVGCAVLRLVDRREVQPVTYEQAANRIQAALYEQKFQEEYTRFIDRLREQTYIEKKGVFRSAAGDRSVSSAPETTRVR